MGITYNDIVHLNSQLYEKEIYYKLQYLDENRASLYSLGSCACDGKQGVFRKYVEDYFAAQGQHVTWNDEDFTFSVEPEHYRVLRIDEADYGCEERPDDYVPQVRVLLEEADGSRRAISAPDEELYEKQINEGDYVQIGADGRLKKED